MMRRSGLPLALPLVLLVLLSQRSAAQPVNLIEDGGFESGEFEGWTGYGLEGYYYPYDYVSSVNPLTGYYAAKLGSYYQSEIGTVVAVTAGQPYQLSFWLQVVQDKRPSYTNSFLATAQSGIGGPNVTLLELTDAPANSQYLHYSALLVPAGSGTTNLTLSFYCEVSDGAFWLDDVSLVAASSLLVNGGFERGDLKGWTQSAAAGVTAHAQTAGAQGLPLSGSFFAALRTTPAAGTAELNTTVQLAADTQYLMTFSLAGDAKTFAVRAQSSSQPHGKLLSSLSSHTASPPGYSQYSLPLPVQSRHGPLTLIFSFSSLRGGFVQLDDVAVVEAVNVTFAPSLAPPNDSVCNGGFETGNLLCWETGNAAVVSSADGLLPYAGSYFALLSGPIVEPAYYAVLYQQQVLQPDSTYLLAFWLAVASPQGPDVNSFTAQLGYVTNSPPAGLQYFAVTDAPASGWTQHFGVITTPNLGSAYRTGLTLTMDATLNTSVFAVDDVTLTPAVSLLSNGGFDSGSFAPEWQVTGSSGGSSAVISSSSSTWSGSYCASVASGQTAQLSTSAATEAGTAYALSLFLTGSPYSVTGTVNITTQFQGEPPVLASLLSGSFYETPQQLQLLIAPQPTAGTLRVFITAELQSGDSNALLIDAVTLLLLQVAK